jgi:succinoglycan biosynthesis protein ExoA
MTEGVSISPACSPGQKTKLVLNEIESDWAAPTKSEVDAPGPTPQLRTVSILIPVRNDASHIGRCLDAVLRQDYPSGLTQIIVADGDSDDATPQIVADYAKRHPNVGIVHNPGRIVPTGFNLALAAADGEIIVRVDGHTTIEPDYVRRCVEALERTGAANAGGRMDAVGRGRFGDTVAEATSNPFGVGGARFHYSTREEWVDTVYMGAWPRRVFEEIGLFDEELVRDQDDEFNYRLREHGGKILLSPNIKSKYTNRSTPRALWKQYFQYGFWKIRVLQKHPKQMRPRQFVPPAFALSLILSLCLAVILPWGWVSLAVVAGCYTLANLTASVVTASRRDWRHMVFLPVVYAILHLSYGLGFLVGLVRFWNRWGDTAGRAPRFDAQQARRQRGSGVDSFRD